MRTIVNFFRCNNCGEHDVDLSRMCRRVDCPKGHVGYTEARFIIPGSDGVIPLREGAEVEPPPTDNPLERITKFYDDEIDPSER